MNANIRKLHRIGLKKSRLIIGLMSGTSLDGLDVALCKIRGSGRGTKIDLLQFATVPYSMDVKDRIRKVFAKQQIVFQDLCELNPWIALLHGDMILDCLRKWKIKPNRIDAIASHGQTVFHAPQSTTKGAEINSTFQIGDGDHLAVHTDIIALSDFRQKHIAGGGEGAPLAMYGDYLLFAKKGEDRVLLNVGGIGNFTFLPASGLAAKVVVTDTGPGNTLLDQVMQKEFQLPFDEDSRLARSGAVHQALLTELKNHPFFQSPFPKTTGPELFNLDYIAEARKRSGSQTISTKDVLATLTYFSAATMAAGIRQQRLKKFKLFISGGGAHNPLLVEQLKNLLPEAEFLPMAHLKIPGDAKEAVLFAVLANESLAGGKTNFGNRSKVPSVSMGKISFPK